MFSILLLEHNSKLQQLILFFLRNEDYKITVATNVKQVLELLKKNTYNLILQDITSGNLELLLHIRHKFPETLVITIIYEYSNITTLEAISIGIFDYIKVPFESNHFINMIHRAYQSQLNQNTVGVDLSLLEEIVGDSSPVQTLKKKILTLAKSDTPIMIFGEQGTGKELVAHMIHSLSLRHSNIFLPVHCASIAHNNIELELLGKPNEKKGLIEIIENGTLFIDEIEEMSLSLQDILLHFLECRELIIPDRQRKYLDTRCICASSQNLDDRVQLEAFSQDLYNLLNVATIYLPPLRERKMDIPILAEYFLEHSILAKEKGIRSFSLEAMEVCLSYHWPNNIHELKNVIERAIALSVQKEIQGDVMQRSLDFNTSLFSSIFEKEENFSDMPSILELSGMETHISIQEKLNDFEEKHIKEALQNSKGNVAAAARLLNITYRTLQYKVKKHHLDDFVKMLHSQEDDEDYWNDEIFNHSKKRD